jgi:hypothetical protein
MRKYYTAFLFEGIDDPKELHCTHKFLGQLSEAEAIVVASGIEEEYREHRFQVPYVQFTRREKFGARKNIPVLLPKDPGVGELLLPRLKSFLDRFKIDEWAYNPHVSTLATKITMRFGAYALITDGGVIVQQWPVEVVDA